VSKATPPEVSPVRKSFSSVSILTLAALGACAGLPACSSPESSGATELDGKSGSIGLELAIGGGLTLNSVAYTISGPNAFTKSGSIDVSNSTELSATIGGIPAGQGYTITLTGTATDGTTSCAGSATFAVTAHSSTAVTVPLDCHQAPHTGSISVNGTINVCPVIDELSASPASVIVGSSIALTGGAHDSDNGPSALTYLWTAGSGTIASSGSTATFTCTTPGTSTITLTVNDGDPAPGCADTLSTTVTCTGGGVVTAVAFVPGSSTEPVFKAGYWAGAKVCVDANNNGACDAAEQPVTTDANGNFSISLTTAAPLLADVPAGATNTADHSTNPSRMVFRAALGQVSEQGNGIAIGPLSSDVMRSMEANGTDYATEKQNLATKLGVSATDVLRDHNALTGATQTAVLHEGYPLSTRFRYAVTKLDRGDLYPDALAVPGGDPELTGLPGVTPATATTSDTRTPITFAQAEQAAFNVEEIPRYDSIFVVMLENKSTQAMLGSAFAPKMNALLAAGNNFASYYATGNPSEPNYTALGAGDDFGITDDSQWNCDATGANAPEDLPVPDKTQPGLAKSPFTATCTQSVGVNHNIKGRPNLFTSMSAAGMTWRTYSESMNPGQDFRTDSVTDSAVVAPDHVYAPGTVGGNTATVGNANLLLPMPAGTYKTKHHPGMAYQAVRSAPEFKYSNRTLGGGQWDPFLLASTDYAIPAGYDIDQLGTDLANGGTGTLNFVIPDQCDDMHGITVSGTITGGGTGTASDCSSIGNNQPVATGGNILTRGDNYVDALVKRIQASPLWGNVQKKVAIVLMFDEGNATAPDINSCCGWKAGKTVTDAPLKQNADGSFSQDTTVNNYANGNQGHGKSLFIVLTNQPTAPKGITDNDVYSHFSFVRTLQDMFLLSDPTKDGSYMNRSKYTEKFIAQNILNLPEFAGSADTHFDSVRPMNHKYVIPLGYTQKATLDDTRPLQTGPDANQTNVWAVK
jgi:PKD domain